MNLSSHPGLSKESSQGTDWGGVALGVELVKWCGPSLHLFNPSSMNQPSILVRAHGVFRRNVRLDFTLGLIWKQRMGMRRPISAQPCRATNFLTMLSSVMPCNGSRGCRTGGDILRWALRLHSPVGGGSDRRSRPCGEVLPPAGRLKAKGWRNHQEKCLDLWALTVTEAGSKV